MLKGHIRPTVKNSSGNKTDLKNCRPVNNSSNFLKVLKYILLPDSRSIFLLIYNHFSYRAATGCVDAKTFLKDIVMYYNLKRSDVYCGMVDLLKAYDRINTSLMCDKMRETDLDRSLLL